MKYGVVTFSAGFGPERFERANALARRAEDAGFDSVWVSELYNRSATVPMATISQATSRVEIGTNIAYGVGRSPLMWAAEARDLDELSSGRILLGLGNGTATMMENWHGVSGESPAVRMEELVTVLRKLWRLDQGPVQHEGRFYKVNLRPTADTPPPFREHLPIYTAGVNPRMVESAGRVADGLVGHPMFTHKYVDEVVRPALARGAEKTRSRRAVARGRPDLLRRRPTSTPRAGGSRTPSASTRRRASTTRCSPSTAGPTRRSGSATRPARATPRP